MEKITLENMESIPHGHGLSFKKGISDGLLGNEPTTDLPSGHEHSYLRGKVLGEALKSQVAENVKR